MEVLEDGEIAEEATERNEAMTEQQIAASLRIKMLQFWIRMVDRPVQISLQDFKVKGIFRGTDREQEFFQVSELETPLFTYPEALIRASDAISLQFTGNN